MNHYRYLLPVWLLAVLPAIAQPRIHAHNDYEKPRPFAEAYEQRADYIEADVWLQDGQLLVAHDRKDLNPARTLDSLYLRPIARLFAQHGGRVSKDRNYTFSLVIDIKDKHEAVIPVLLERLQSCLSCFNRLGNPLAVQVVLSGNRPKPDLFLDQSALLQFDGRPSEVYDDETLRRVAFVSDSFYNYSRWNGTGELSDADREKLKRTIKRAHLQNKLIRFWAIPDTPDAWKQLRKLGVDIINTDKVAEATQVLK
jgi:glycerophosphoryl diester phosphodiesterase